MIIDEAQDFGMMAYGALSYCLRNCTYTIMGDVSQNIHYGYGLNDWEELKGLMLKGISGGFGVLKKSYRNTVEISDFATGILKHGNFPVYPVDPVERHGNPVRVTGCSDETDMLLETVKAVRKWQADGRETIAVICRDEMAASRVNKALSCKLDLADSRLETAEFTEGVMVLPVEYTKGLEFDAVVLYDPSEKNYPAEDGYVKLLYVAATRALHELAVIHAGDLTDLIAKPVPQEKHLQVLEAEENKSKTAKDGTVTHPQAVEGTTAAHPHTAGTSGKGTGPGISRRRLPGSGQGSKKTLNPSPYPFGSIPDTRLLTRQEPCPADLSIRDIKRTEKDLDLISRQGILRLTPESEDVIRVRFVSREVPTSGPGAWNFLPDKSVPWTARAGRSLVELSTAKITVQIDKRSGALRFLSRDGRRLLTEKTALPRQVEGGKRVRTWEYFDWQKEEKLSAKGILAEDLERMDHKARYISFGGKRLRMPLLVSKYGYGLGIAAEETVLCCNIPMYGTYLYTEGPGQIDYYFIYGEDYSRILELYQKIQ